MSRDSNCNDIMVSFQTLSRGKLLLFETDIHVSVRGALVERGSLGHVQKHDVTGGVYKAEKLVENVNTKQF